MSIILKPNMAGVADGTLAAQRPAGSAAAARPALPGNTAASWEVLAAPSFIRKETDPVKGAMYHFFIAANQNDAGDSSGSSRVEQVLNIPNLVAGSALFMGFDFKHNNYGRVSGHNLCMQFKNEGNGSPTMSLDCFSTNNSGDLNVHSNQEDHPVTSPADVWERWIIGFNVTKGPNTGSRVRAWRNGTLIVDEPNWLCNDAKTIDGVNTWSGGLLYNKSDRNSAYIKYGIYGAIHGTDRHHYLANIILATTPEEAGLSTAGGGGGTTPTGPVVRFQGDTIAAHAATSVSNSGVNGTAATQTTDPAAPNTENVMVMRTAEADTDGVVVRAQAISGNFITNGETFWNVFGVYVPSTIPSVPAGAANWVQLNSHHGAPSGGQAVARLCLVGTKPDSTHHNVALLDAAGNVKVSTVIPCNQWVKFARRVFMAADATGWVEVYKSDTWAGDLALVGTRQSYATYDPAINGGDANYVRIANFHPQLMSGWTGTQNIYFKKHRVYDGGTTLDQLNAMTDLGEGTAPPPPVTPTERPSPANPVQVASAVGEITFTWATPPSSAGFLTTDNWQVYRSGTRIVDLPNASRSYTLTGLGGGEQAGIRISYGNDTNGYSGWSDPEVLMSAGQAQPNPDVAGSAEITLTANPTGLAAGTRTAVVTITDQFGGKDFINVAWTITAPVTLVANRAVIAFDQVQESTPASAPIRVLVENSGGTGNTGFTVNTGNPAVTYTATGAAAPANIDFTFSPRGLTPGVKSGTIQIIGPNNTISIPWSVTVQADPASPEEQPTGENIETFLFKNTGDGLTGFKVILTPAGETAELNLEPGEIFSTTDGQLSSVLVEAFVRPGLLGQPDSEPLVIDFFRLMDYPSDADYPADDTFPTDQDVG